MQEPGFAQTGLPAVFELLAPAALDVQTDERLVRLERHQGEYWVLTLMLAGLKTQWSQCVTRQLERYKYFNGFFADQLHGVLEQLPPWLWADKRRKRSYVNQVLARAEVHSSYQPARRLWVRLRNGFYFPNARMQLRAGEGWQPVYEHFALNWVDRGCGREYDIWPRPLQSIGWVREVLERGPTAESLAGIASGSASESTSGTSAGMPADTHADAPADTPADAPADTPSAASGGTSARAPADAPATAAARAPARPPADTPSGTAVDAPADTPAGSPDTPSAPMRGEQLQLL